MGDVERQTQYPAERDQEGPLTVQRKVGPLSYRPADTSPDLVNLTVGELLRSAVERAPTRCAAVDASDPTRRWTYAEMWDISVGIARALLDRHPPGSYIAIWGPTSPEWLFIEFGIALAGMTL